MMNVGTWLKTWRWLLPWATLLAGVLLANRLSAADGTNLEAKVTVQVRPAQTLVVSPVTIEYTVQVPKGMEVSFPPLGDRLGDLEVRDVRTIEDLPVDESTRHWILQVEAEAFKPGTYALPPLEFEIWDPRTEGSRQSQRLQSPTASVVVRSVLDEQANPAEFRDIKPVVFVTPEPEPDWGWAWWVAGGLVASLAFVAFMLVWRRGKGPSHLDWALRALDDLRQRHATEGLDGEALYVQLTNIVRLFLEREFEIGASRLTTPEFLVQLQSDQRLPRELQSRLASFLETADQVKFAAWVPEEDSRQTVFDEARALLLDAHQVRQRADEQNAKEDV